MADGHLVGLGPAPEDAGGVKQKGDPGNPGGHLSQPLRSKGQINEIEQGGQQVEESYGAENFGADHGNHSRVSLLLPLQFLHGLVHFFEFFLKSRVVPMAGPRHFNPCSSRVFRKLYPYPAMG